MSHQDQGFRYSLYNSRDNANSGNANIQQAVEIAGGGSSGPFIKGNTYTLSGWIQGSSGQTIFCHQSGYSDAVNSNW